MSRDWHIHERGGCVAVGEGGYSFTREVVFLNPDQKRWYKHGYVLWFGGCGATYLHVFADSLDDALEECAEWLVEHAPGHIMKHGSEEHSEFLKEACEEHGVEYDPSKLCGVIESPYEQILQSAEADLTYTESGFLTSYEWGISLEDPDGATLYTFIKGT